MKGSSVKVLFPGVILNRVTPAKLAVFNLFGHKRACVVAHGGHSNFSAHVQRKIATGNLPWTDSKLGNLKWVGSQRISRSFGGKVSWVISQLGQMFEAIDLFHLEDSWRCDGNDGSLAMVVFPVDR